MKIEKKLSLLIALSIIIAYLLGPITVIAINCLEEPVKEATISTVQVVEPEPEPIVIVEEKETETETVVIEETAEPELLSLDEIIKEINAGKWGNGDDRKQALIKAGYNYEEIQKAINKQQPSPKKVVNKPTKHNYTGRLTKSGGVYYNPYTGLKETWYSQRVLPGRGLRIPGRHVNSEGFVCDKDGYVCVASSDYKKGTIIETSRGMGKVYDCGCASGILDLYVNW